jgi:Tol biopolymer transport system component
MRAILPAEGLRVVQPNERFVDERRRLKRVLAPLAGHVAARPRSTSVSPNGAEIVYLSDNGGHGNLWIAPTDGSTVRQTTFERDPAINQLGVPTWSPAGDWIVFAVAHRRISAIWLIRPDGSGLHEPVPSGWVTCWQSDGRHLIYTAGREGTWSELRWKEASRSSCEPLPHRLRSPLTERPCTTFMA